MFESAELGHKVDKEEFAKQVPLLRDGLLEAQSELLAASKFPVIILINGADGAGKGETVNLLNSWMDPRHVQTHGITQQTDEERARPRMWRFWRALPPKGKVGIFFGSWYSEPVLRRVYGEIKNPEMEQYLDEIVKFERMLTDEGALLLKFWFHLAKGTQKKRLKTLSSSPKTRWRVTDLDWKHFDLYDKFRRINERVIVHTSAAEAPWTIVDGSDARYRSLLVGRTILEGIRGRLDHLARQKAAAQLQNGPAPTSGHDGHGSPSGVATVSTPVGNGVDLLRSLDLTQTVQKKEYEDRLAEYQGRLNTLMRQKEFRRHALVLAMEGADAAGKGGTIRRISGALDARQYRIVPIAAPTDEERRQPYLWRFWRHIPGVGKMVIFDRTWYGRVLVERIEGFASESAWHRAYDEINDFESQLSRAGVVVVKFWMHISKEEQLRRFKEREQTSFKRYKITEEDWRNREKWEQYEQAVCEMVDRTSTEHAPWTLVEANDKYFARVKVLKTVVDQLEKQLG
jgi:polyphosphate:AMP phosphotransferase